MEEHESYKQYEVKEAIIFLIDLSSHLFTPIIDLNLECQLTEILQCINELMADMVMTFPKNGVGIYLYNSKETSKKFPKNSGISKIFSLNDLNSSNMKILTHILRDQADGFKPLKDRFTVEDDRKDNLHTVLKTVLREFQVKPQYNVKKLFWITHSSTPYENPDLKDSLRTLVSDFEDNHIYITPIFLDIFDDEAQKLKKPFDPTLYQHIFLNTNYLKYETAEDNPFGDEDAPKWLSPTVSSQIRQAIFRLAEVRRIQFACDLILSDGPQMGGNLGCSIKGYTLYNHEHIRAFRQVVTEGAGLKLVHHDTQVLRKDTLETIETEKETKKLLVKGFPVKVTNNEEESSGPNEKVLYFNNEVVEYMNGRSFDHTTGKKDDNRDNEKDEDEDDEDGDEDANLVTFSNPPYLKLLCFRDTLKFQPYFNIKASIFVTADFSDGLNSSSKEGGYTKSFNTFRSLYQTCIRMNRYAVLFGCIRKNSNPRIYALYPTNTGSKTEAARSFPDGFLLIALPWLSEVRSLPDYMLTDNRYFYPENEATSPPELVNLYKKLLDKFGVESYVPGDHSNPVLKYFYKVIKHEALQIDIKDEDLSVEANDWSLAKLAALREKVTNDLDTEELFLFINMYLNKVSNAELIKRAAEESREPLKKAKAEPLSEAAIITLWKNDAWNKVTVAQLRAFMGKYDKIKSATKKADMIANIIEFLESRQRSQ